MNHPTPNRVIITGGAGFLGSHLAQHALEQGRHVTVIDNLATGSLANINHLISHPHFTFTQGDIRNPLETPGPVEVIFNLASPASPPVYSAARVDCLTTNAHGIANITSLAHRTGARLVQASTSEVYGDPLHHPQTETDWGNVNPIGERSCYDEGKRYAESYLMAHRHEHGTNTGIVRIFNTYGPHMHPHDGRVISGFIRQALTGEPITVYGDGTQTRSFCYVTDMVEALWAMGQSDHPGPINLGNPEEHTITHMAHTIRDLVGSTSEIVHLPLPSDDPTRRRPSIALAKRHLNWEPRTPLHAGLQHVIDWQRTLNPNT